MERTPFNKNVSLRAYLNKGKDLNITKNGVSLIEHLLSQSFNDATVYYSLTRLVAHPHCTPDKSKIQQLLYSSHDNFQFGAIKTDEQKSAFINKFDLANNIYIAPNSGDMPRGVHYSIGWLQFFLLGENSFHLFDWAREHNKDYSVGLKATDKFGFNVWHTLASAVSNMRDNSDRFNKVHEKLNVLFQDYPEGLESKNSFNETAYEMLDRMRKEDKYMYYENIQKIMTVLEYFQLQLDVKNKNSNTNKKMKV